MAKYRKIDPRIWNDEKFYTASLSCQHLFLFILTHPSMTPVGAMRVSPAALEAELDWASKGFPEGFPEAFAEGCGKGFWKYDSKAKFLLVPNFLKYNRPESPNVVKSWAGCWDDLPECDHKLKLYQSLKGFAEGCGEAFAKAFAEAFTKDFLKAYAKTLLNQEQEQEQEQEQDFDPTTGEILGNPFGKNVVGGSG